jgi:hypothetical protein
MVLSLEAEMHDIAKKLALVVDGMGYTGFLCGVPSPTLLSLRLVRMARQGPRCSSCASSLYFLFLLFFVAFKVFFSIL